MLLGFDMTHRCNLLCSFCWKFMDKAEFGDITDEQVEKFCAYFSNVQTPYIRIVGGEPLVHPKFKDIILRLGQTFIDMDFLVVTNGMLLTDELVRLPNTNYIVTQYPQNQAVIRKFSGRVTVTKRDYFDRDHDPDLSDEQARDIHKRCGYRQLRVIGDNLYDCCHAETLERLGRSPSVHVKVKRNCDIELLNRTDTWKECIHCFIGDGGKLV